MKIGLRLEGQDDGEDSLIDLQDWINRERIHGIRVQRGSKPFAAGEMGAELSDTLAVIGPIVTPVLVELIKSAFGWLRTRNPKVKIKLKVGSNLAEVELTNVSNEQQIIKEISALGDALRP